MSKPGPKPTPARVLKMRGSWRAGEREETEIPADGIVPHAPEWIEGRAREMWDRICAQMIAAQTISEIDENVLARYCATWAEWRDAHEYVRKRGQAHITKDKDGNVTGMRLWPQTRLMRDLGTELSRMEGVLFIGPGNRAGGIVSRGTSDLDKFRAEFAG